VLAALVGLMGAKSSECVLCLQVPPEISAGEEKRQGVEQAEVVFALPVDEHGAPSPNPHAQLFAFLPVRAYGFR
jgi:hypothetical protein